MDPKDEEKEIVRILTEESRTSKRNSIISLLISFVALFISLGSLYFANKDDNDDSNWRNLQKGWSEQMIEEQSETNEKLDSIKDSFKDLNQKINKLEDEVSKIKSEKELKKKKTNTQQNAKRQ